MPNLPINTHDFHDSVYSQDFPRTTPDGRPQPHGWIQWKGIDACIDLHCKCGYHGHMDADFFYFYECPHCEAKYAVGQVVKLIELTAEQAEAVANGAGAGVGFKSDRDAYEVEVAMQEREGDDNDA